MKISQEHVKVNNFVNLLREKSIKRLILDTLRTRAYRPYTWVCTNSACTYVKGIRYNNGGNVFSSFVVQSVNMLHGTNVMCMCTCTYVGLHVLWVAISNHGPYKHQTLSPVCGAIICLALWYVMSAIWYAPLLNAPLVSGHHGTWHQPQGVWFDIILIGDPFHRQ